MQTDREKSETGVSAPASPSFKPRWMWALSKSEIPYEGDQLLQWLARFPIDHNHPRPITHRVPVHVAGTEVMTLSSEEKLHKAFMKLTVEGFMGAPVLDAQERYIGYLELNDIVTHVCDVFRAFYGETYYVPSDPLLKKQWADFFQTDRFTQMRVGELIFTANIARTKPPCFPAYRGFSTLWAMEEMARLGCHRVPILDAGHKVHGLLTQSMLISLFDQNLIKFGMLRYAKVSEIQGGLGWSVKTVQEDSLAINAFKMMSTFNISGIAVVDSKGAIVDAITVRDLRHIGCKVEHFERLWHTVKSFKEQVRQEFKKQTPSVPITCSLNDTLETVIKKMDDGNIYRVWCCDANNIPIHVITQCDVLRLLLYKMGFEPIWTLSSLY